MEEFTWKQIILMICILLSGGLITLCKKAQFDSYAKGYDDKVHSFDHPLFQLWMMFTAQSLSLVIWLAVRRSETQQYKRQTVLKVHNNDHVEVQEEPRSNARICQWVLIIPTCASILVNAMIGIGLLYVDASIMLMLRGSVIIFTGLFSHLFLKRKLKLAKWIGIAVVIVGLVLAGCSCVFKNQDHKTIRGKAITGIILIVSAQIVAGGQFVMEESLLKSRNIHPFHLVGMKGIYGLVLMTFVVLPALYFIPGDNANGSFENSIDALIQISNSTQLLLICLLYIIAVAVYNCTGMAIVKSMSAMHRTLISTCRTILVWAVGLTIYYGIDKNFGEPFDKAYGILQIDGFFFIIIGTFIYNNILELKYFTPCQRCSTGEISETAEHDRDASEKQKDSGNDICDERSRLLTENKAY